jgi:hypothetical protein
MRRENGKGSKDKVGMKRIREARTNKEENGKKI